MLNYVLLQQAYKLQAGFPSLDACQHEAEKLRTMVNCFECVKYYLLSKSPELGLEIGLKYVKGMVGLAHRNNISCKMSRVIRKPAFCIYAYIQR